MDGDDIAVLDAQIVPHNAVYAGGAVIQVVVSKHDEDRVLPLLALDQHCVAAEQLERLHRVVRERNDRVVIRNGIRDAVTGLAATEYAYRQHKHTSASWASSSS